MAVPIKGAVAPVAQRLLKSPEPAGLKMRDGERPGKAAPGSLFVQMLREEVGKVNQTHVQADRKAEALVTGASGDIHGTMVALSRADLSFRLMTQVRNKALEAYQELMRMNL